MSPYNPFSSFKNRRAQSVFWEWGSGASGPFMDRTDISWYRKMMRIKTFQVCIRWLVLVSRRWCSESSACLPSLKQSLNFISMNDAENERGFLKNYAIGKGLQNLW